MLDRLATGPTSVSELARPLAMTLAAVLQHVQVLESSGLIRSHKAGRVRVCTLDEAALRATEQWLTDRRTVWEGRLDRLGAVLDEPGPPGAPQVPDTPGAVEITPTAQQETAPRGQEKGDLP